MKKMFNEGNQIHNFMSSSGSGTVINYGSGSGSNFLTSYGSDYGSGSTSQKVTVPTVPVPVPQHCWEIAIYAPMIYTTPCIMFWMHAYSLRGQVGEGWGPGNREFFGPCEMASSR